MDRAEQERWRQIKSLQHLLAKCFPQEKVCGPRTFSKPQQNPKQRTKKKITSRDNHSIFIGKGCWLFFFFFFQNHLIQPHCPGTGQPTGQESTEYLISALFSRQPQHGSSQMMCMGEQVCYHSKQAPGHGGFNSSEELRGAKGSVIECTQLSSSLSSCSTLNKAPKKAPWAAPAENAPCCHIPAYLNSPPLSHEGKLLNPQTQTNRNSLKTFTHTAQLHFNNSNCGGLSVVFIQAWR